MQRLRYRYIALKKNRFGGHGSREVPEIPKIVEVFFRQKRMKESN